MFSGGLGSNNNKVHIDSSPIKSEDSAFVDQPLLKEMSAVSDIQPHDKIDNLVRQKPSSLNSSRTITMQSSFASITEIFCRGISPPKIVPGEESTVAISYSNSPPSLNDLNSINSEQDFMPGSLGVLEEPLKAIGGSLRELEKQVKMLEEISKEDVTQVNYKEVVDVLTNGTEKVVSLIKDLTKMNVSCNRDENLRRSEPLVGVISSYNTRVITVFKALEERRKDNDSLRNLSDSIVSQVVDGVYLNGSSSILRSEGSEIGLKNWGVYFKIGKACNDIAKEKGDFSGIEERELQTERQEYQELKDLGRSIDSKKEELQNLKVDFKKDNGFCLFGPQRKEFAHSKTDLKHEIKQAEEAFESKQKAIGSRRSSVQLYDEKFMESFSSFTDKFRVLSPEQHSRISAFLKKVERQYPNGEVKELRSVLEHFRTGSKKPLEINPRNFDLELVQDVMIECASSDLHDCLEGKLHSKK